ncbi:unnamed protein product [Spodoptera exigua]|nr:unnamed protein product [Spodoptera exigua]
MKRVLNLLIICYEVLSTGPALLIQFTANSATPGQGFAATFLFQPPPDSTAADSDRLLKLSFGKAFESLGPEVSATTFNNMYITQEAQYSSLRGSLDASLCSSTRN